jgi:Tetratricopeptide repeat/Cytochrome c554 and c-prime
MKTSGLKLLFLFATLLLFPSVRLAPAKGGIQADYYVGSSACAACHLSIYKSYSTTPMALSSGKVGTGAFQESFAASQFFHSRSGVRYRVFKEQNNYYFEFTREASQTSSREIRGQRRLDYFIGSGAMGRSYLFALDRFLFQAPVAYYAMLGQWNLSPGYEQSEQINLTRPIETGCLECHASRLQPVAGTQNRFGEIPFLEGGIGCERCHGPGRQHLTKMSSGQMGGSREIVNPAKLEPLRRDSVCAQCHLTGEARIAKAGRSLLTFRPGELLSDHVVSFVWSSRNERGIKVTSHFEKLWQSTCKKASGERLSCVSCHNPHTVPAEIERKEYFRQKCLACHQNSDCKLRIELRVKKGDDCVACHMPKSQALDVDHAVFTDHSIPRLTDGEPQRKPETTERSLIPFGGSAAEARDLGLAYAEAAVQEQNEAYYTRAFELLKKAEAERPGDARVLEQLAYLYDRLNDENKAMALYERAVRANPAQLVAAVNLGSLLARRGRFQEAIRLWEDALSRNPGLETARVYLAMAYLQSGNPTAAEAALLKALEYSPDSQPARKFLLELRQKKSQQSK